MKTIHLKAGRALTVTLLLALARPTIAADVDAIGFAKFEVWTGITGTAVADLTGDPKYGGPPDATLFIVGIDSPSGYADNYGARVSGFIVPSESGDFDFFLRSDDASQLFLSASETPPNPASDAPIAEEVGCCNAFVEPGGAQTTAAPISLVGGKRYAFIALLKEGGGGDYVQVAMRKVGDATAASGLKPIGGKNLVVKVPDNGAKIDITQQPQDQQITEGRTATLKVAAKASSTTETSLPIGYQWQKNGVDIAGATKDTLVTSRLQIADSGVKYSVTLFTLGASATSTAGTVSVVADTVPPSVVSAGSLKNGSGTEVGVIFDESVDQASATTVANYSLDSGTVTAARFVSNSSGTDTLEQGVVLTVTGVTPGKTYTLTVKGISDAKGNAMTTPVTVTFTPSAFTWISIGTVADFKPDAIATEPDGFNLISGGNAFWASEDDITMVYEEITGDFDKSARVEFSDPSSNWARSGISARESLNNGAPTTDASGDNPAARYQMIISDPATKFDGTAANNQYETNRRLVIGGATSSSNGGGTPPYPNSYVRLKRVGQNISMYFSPDGSGTWWRPLGTTDFGDIDTVTDGPLPDKLFVGPTFGPENGNITDTTLRGVWATRIRQYGDAIKTQKPLGAQPYGIGLNFGANESGSPLSPVDVAGLDSVAQANWNNIFGANSDAGPITGIKADKKGIAATTTVTVEFASANTWASTSRGEENNQFKGADAILMIGYLDSGSATTSHATIAGIPSDLTGTGYDVVVYLLGGVPGRGGAYRLLDSTGKVLNDYVRVQYNANATSFVEVPADTNPAGDPPIGNYIVFKNLKVPSITVEATTETSPFGAAPRAPINAIQLVPTGLTGTVAPTIKIAATSTGATITYTGTLQSAAAVIGPWSDVTGATSPFSVNTSGAGQTFYRSK